MDVAIHLEPYNQTFSLSRAFILSTLAGSLFAEALDVDPNATRISLSNPIVTPAVMQFLVDYSQGKEPERHIPDLIQASRYLNIPWMMYYVDPLYDEITDRVNWFSEENHAIFEEAIRENKYWLVNYYLSKGVKPIEDDIRAAIESKALNVFTLLLPMVEDGNLTELLSLAVENQFKPGVETFIAMGAPISRTMLMRAIDQPDIFKRLLDKAEQDQKIIYPEFNALIPYENIVKAFIKTTAATGKLGTLDLLLSTNISPSFNQNVALEEAIEANPDNIVEVTKHFLAHSLFNPNLQLPTLIIAAALINQEEIIKLLLQDPRTHLTPDILDFIITRLNGRVSPKMLLLLESFRN
jgi:ankyrin repeat protein